MSRCYGALHDGKCFAKKGVDRLIFRATDRNGVPLRKVIPNRGGGGPGGAGRAQNHHRWCI